MKLILFCLYLHLVFYGQTQAVDPEQKHREKWDESYTHFQWKLWSSILHQGIQPPTILERNPATERNLAKVRNCFDQFCPADPVTKLDIANVNPSQTLPIGSPEAKEFLNYQIEFLSNVEAKCHAEYQERKREFIKNNPHASSMTSSLDSDFQAKIRSLHISCLQKLNTMSVNQKYIADYQFLVKTKEDVLSMLEDIFDHQTIEDLRIAEKEFRHSCYYQKYNDDIIEYRYKSKCQELVNETFSSTDRSSLSTACTPLDNTNYGPYPFDSTFPSSGDTNWGKNIIISNQSCQNKELGRGIVAHEFAHMYSTLFSKLTNKTNHSLQNFRRVRQCLNSMYSQRRKPQPIMVRDNFDELTTEEDFADLFKFHLTQARYYYACDIMNYAKLQLPQLERRELLGVYDLIDYSNPHSTPMFRLLHESIHRHIELPAICQEVEMEAQYLFKVKTCWPSK